VTLLGRLFRLVWGGDIDPALRPVLAVGLVGSIAGATVYPFMGIWAIKHLHAPQGELAFAYLAGAVLAGLTGYVGGHVSDHVGRRPMILVGWGLGALVPLLLLAVGTHVYWGLALLALLPVLGSLGGAADSAMVASWRPSGRRVPTPPSGSRTTSGSRSGRPSEACSSSAASGSTFSRAPSCWPRSPL
jgi:MFS family permease